MVFVVTMTRRKSVCIKWTLVLLVVLVCPYVCARPQETASVKTESTTENLISITSGNPTEEVKIAEAKSPAPAVVTPESSRDVKTKVPIRESIKLVANQLLDKPNVTTDNTLVMDSRIPPKVKNQQKHKVKTRNEDGVEAENAHAGEAVPVSMEEIENITPENESTTSTEGISTWVLVSSPNSKENTTMSTEATKTDDVKKQKPSAPKNKNKKPQSNKTTTKLPTISNINKSDIAGSTATNENKNKDVVQSNAQKKKNTSNQRPAKTTTTTTPLPETTTKKEVTKSPVKASPSTPAKSTTKPKKKNKNKQKVSTTTTVEPDLSDSALLPMEAKEPEIELEVSTPPVTTKKPKRKSTKKKNKTKRKPKPDTEVSISDIKTASNKTKAVKAGKKPQPAQTAITSQLYNYFSREVMPSVGVGVLGLASIVGIASYFFYPFSTPVRRTFEVDKKDDLYKNNAEEYANDGNGQAEEEMLGTVLAGMPTHAKNKLNPYAGQTAYVNRYPVKKEQDLRYRQVATKYDQSNYNTRYPQQKTGIAHAAVYPKPSSYSPHYETRHAYTTEGKFNFDKLPTSYAPYPAVEHIYAAPQTAPSSPGVSSYGNDASNSVVYGVKPSSESDFKPVYPFENQFYSESTNSPATYAPSSLYLGSNNEDQQEEKYEETSNASSEVDESKFVVGNVPKELAESATPAVVPEHGPRTLNKRKRRTLRKRSISSSIEEILRMEKENKDVFISNEISDSYAVPLKKLASMTETLPVSDGLPTSAKPEEVFTVYAASAHPTKPAEEITTLKNDIIESVSTVPISDERKASTTAESEPEATTKTFKVYEVFSTPDATVSPIVKEVKPETTTQFRNIMTETTTETRLETTSTMPPSPSAITEPRDVLTSTLRPTPILEVVTYPPLNQSGGIFSFFNRLIDFKKRLGASILLNFADFVEKTLKG